MRRPIARALRAAAMALFLIALPQLHGCTTAAALRGEAGKDISAIKPGVTRSAAEELLGLPLREWTTPANIRYRVYRYDAGVPPSRSDAGAYIFLNIISAGLFELYEATGATDLSKPSADDSRRVWRQVAIAYDPGDRIVGVFDNFGDLDVLPDDGRPPAPPSLK